jgi:2-iminobutanoate/2-iminopropanoate deaminase
MGREVALARPVGPKSINRPNTPSAMSEPLPIELSSPPDLFPGITYEHTAVVGDFVFVAGQVARNAKGETIAPNDTAGQTGPMWENVRHALAHVGCTPEDVVKVTTYLLDTTNDTAVVLEAHKKFFGTHRPPHTLVGVSGFTRPGMRIEVEVIARRRK